MGLTRPGYDCAGADYATAPYGHTRQNHGIGADPDVIFDDDCPVDIVLFRDRLCHIVLAVLIRNQLCTRSNLHAPPNRYTASTVNHGKMVDFAGASNTYPATRARDIRISVQGNAGGDFDASGGTCVKRAFRVYFNPSTKGRFDPDF